MKKTQKILGLPIISISDGLEVGKVKSIIINADRGAIDYFVVDSGIQIFSARVVPTEDVLGIGEYALTIENEGVITDISKIPAAIQLLQNDIKVKGTKVLTRKGSLIGEIGDLYIDDEDGCKIKGLEFIADITQKTIRLIPRDAVITFGKNLTVVKENIGEMLLDSASQLSSGGSSYLFPYEEEQTIEEEFTVPEAETPEIPAEEPAEQETGSEEADDAAVLFEQRQRQYLRGRTATKSIYDNSGNVIIHEGMKIDDAVIDDAKSKGKLIELVMNNRA